MQAVAMVYEDNNMETTDAFNNHGSGVAGGGINISRLKSMFQTDSDKENRGRSRRGGRGGGGDDGRSGVYSSMTNVQRSPDSKRKRPDTLEMNKNHANMYKSRSVSVDRVVGNNTNSIDIPEPTDVDTQKLYETTNHVQRFHFTRAIFAKMEEESKRKTPDGSSRNNSRSVSPGGGRAVSHSPMRYWQ